jgi:hypothetical protein
MSRLHARSTEISTQCNRRRASIPETRAISLPTIINSPSLRCEVYSPRREAAIGFTPLGAGTYAHTERACLRHPGDGGKGDREDGTTGGRKRHREGSSSPVRSMSQLTAEESR